MSNAHRSAPPSVILWIRTRRELQTPKWTQEYLAAQAGISAGSVSNIENGQQGIGPGIAASLCRVFGVPTNEENQAILWMRGLISTPPSTIAAELNLYSGESVSVTDRMVVAIPSSAAIAPGIIPIPPTALIGRQDDLIAIQGLLGEKRLVTLIGPGGVGKTRLALEIAASVRSHFSGGAWLIDLAPIRDPNLILPALAATLGIKEHAGEPLRQAVHGYLRNHNLLLLLDNFEQVAAGAIYIADLLAAAGFVKILVTSRVPLHIRGEQRYTVDPLRHPDPGALPPADRLHEYEAIQLFTERAREGQADFRLTVDNAAAVAAICARLDGLPLALELAAARLHTWSPDELLEQLTQRLPVLVGGPLDLPTRQQTMRNAIAWSYDLLTPSAQALFRHLAVFRGGFHKAAAVMVAGADHTDLGTLMDSGLLRQSRDSSGRYTMLETIHEFAGELMEATDESAHLSATHAAYYLALAEAVAPPVSPALTAGFDQLAQEHDNLRAALEWSLTSNPEVGLRLVGALWRFWQVRGHWREGRQWAEQLLAATPSTKAELRALALTGLGTLAWVQADYHSALAAHDQARAIYELLGDSEGCAMALNNMGLQLFALLDYTGALAYTLESVELYQKIGDPYGIAEALNNLGVIREGQGDFPAAIAIWLDALYALQARSEDSLLKALLWANLGFALLRQGQFVEARRYLLLALKNYVNFGDKRAIVKALAGIAAAIPDRAALLSAVVDREIAVDKELSFESIDHAIYTHALATLCARVEVSQWQETYRQGQQMDLDSAVQIALDAADLTQG